MAAGGAEGGSGASEEPGWVQVLFFRGGEVNSSSFTRCDLSGGGEGATDVLEGLEWLGSGAPLAGERDFFGTGFDSVDEGVERDGVFEGSGVEDTSGRERFDG